ncbi:diaminopimelate decarboxylase [Clostridia bacterium]|nr:diaminopimelate decarboxylase [Clostridia bacterium]
MADKKPFVTLETIQKIPHKTPYHIYDERGIRLCARDVNRAFSWNAGFKEYFAVKATPNPRILQILKEEGCGADCSSLTELMLARAAGFYGHEIMFSSNATPAEEFVYANKIGALINFDDYSHIEFFKKHVGQFPDTISVRYNPGGAFSVHSQIMDTPADAKFGLTKEQVISAFAELRAEGVKNFGLHSFLASNTLTNDYYPRIAEILFELAVELREKTGAEVGFINLSGGVGIPYKPEDTPNDILKIGEGVRKAYEKILLPANMGGIAIFTEMGRFMLGPYGHLISTVLHKKNIYKTYVGLDASAVNLMRPAIYGAYHHISVLGKENEPATETYDVTGALCENNDKFAKSRQLPPIEAGDIVAIHDTGAHGHAMGYNYNGKLRSAEILLKENGETEVIRRAETAEDYFATLDFKIDTSL